MGIGALIVAAVSSLAAGSAVAVAIGLVIDVALTVAANSLLSKKGNKGGGASERRGRSENIRSTTLPHQVIYGQCRKGGLIFYINGTGKDNKYLNIGLAFSANQCEAVEHVYFNGENIHLLSPTATRGASSKEISSYESGGFFGADDDDWDGTTYVGKVYESPPGTYLVHIGNRPSGSLRDYAYMKIKLGAEDQSAESAMVSHNSNWGNDHRARGICYLYAHLKYSQEKFPSFIPAITARIKGENRIFDPRDSGTRWTDNPALIVADVLERYLRVPRSRIDVDHLKAAADICDQIVDGEKRYVAGGFIDLEGDPSEWMLPFVTAMAGNVTEFSGIYYINAGAYKAPELTLTLDNVVSGVSYRTAASDFSRSNAVKGVYVGPESYDQPSEFPAIKNTTAIAEDGGVLNWLDLDLEMVPNANQAQRVANILLLSSREDETIELSVDLEAGLDVKPWDTIETAFSDLGITGTWQVQTHALNVGSGEGMQVDLTLKRHTSAAYNAGVLQPVSNPSTNIPGSAVNVPQLVQYTAAFHPTKTEHHPADITLTWNDPSGSVDTLELELTLSYQSRIIDTDTGTAGDQAGAWIDQTITETQVIAEGLQTVVVPLKKLGIDWDDPSGYEFQTHVVTTVRLRSKINSTQWSEWADASLS